MKKRVIIESTPKKRVVIEGLPKAQIGKRIKKTSNVERDGVTLASLRNPFPKLTAPTQKKWKSWTPQNTENQPITAQDNVSDDIYYTPSETEFNANNSMSDIQNKKKIRKPGTTNFKFNVPHFYPNVGNKYLQQSVMDFNDAATYASNIGKSSKGINTPPTTYNPYVNMYYGEHGGSLPIAEWGYQSFQPSYTTPPSNLQPLNIEMPQYQVDQNPQLTPAAPSLTEGLQEIELNKNNYNNSSSADAWKTAGAIAGTVSKIGSGVTHALKGGLDISGTVASNKGEQLAKDQAYTESVFNKAMNVTPYETQGYGVQGRNALGYGADGMQIKQIGGMGEPNVEIEGNEHVQLPNGFSQEAKGKSHAQGGIPMNLPQGTKIFSEKLKVPVKFIQELISVNPEYAFLKNISLPKSGNISYADLAKKFETKKYVDMLNSKDADPIQITTAQLMIQQNNAFLEKLFTLQEQNKISGVHGPEVQQNAKQEIAETQSQEKQEPQQEQSMMKYGGYLPMAQIGKMQNQTDDYNHVGYYNPEGVVNYGKNTSSLLAVPNYYSALSSPEFKASMSKIAHPSESEGFFDYAGNLLNTPLSFVSAGLTGKYGTTGNLYSDIILDPLTYVGINEAKWAAKGVKYLGKEAVELVAKYGPEAAKLIKEYGVKGVELVKKFGPKAVEVLKSPTTQNILRSGVTRGVAGYQQEKERDKQIQKIVAENKTLKEQQSAKIQPIVTPTTVPSDTIGTWQDMPLIQSKEEFAYGGILPEYQNAGKTGKKIVGTELNKSGTKVRITYSDGSTEIQDYVSQRPTQPATFQSSVKTPYNSPFTVQNQTPFISQINIPATKTNTTKRSKTTTKNTADSRFKNGIWTGDYNQTQNPKVTIPFAPQTSNTWNAMTDYSDVNEYAKAVGYTGKIDPKDPKGTGLAIQKYIETIPGGAALIAKYHDPSMYGMPKGHPQDPFDGILGKRWQAIANEINQPKTSPPTFTIPGTLTAKGTMIPNKDEQNKPLAPQVVNKKYEIPGMNLGIGLPNIDERLRLNWYYPDYATIDPRYLDIQPELNTIGRAQRTVQGNLGSRGATDIANLLQAQVNAGQQQQQAYGTKYNYDRAQDANAQQFNAQAYNQWAPQKQQSWYQQLEDPYRREESIIGTKKAMREQSDIENARQMQAFYNNKDYISNAFNPFANLSEDEMLALAFSESNPFSQYMPNKSKKKKKMYTVENPDDTDDTEETTQTSKMGGKIKIKPKLKPKYR